MSPYKPKHKNRIIPKGDMLKILKYCTDKGDLDFYFYDEDNYFSLYI